MRQSEWLDLGMGTLARRSEVIAVHDGEPDGSVELTVTFKDTKARCLVVLRGGHLMPAYVKAETVRRHLRERGEPGRPVPPDVAQALRNLRKYLENTVVDPDYEDVWTVVHYLEAAQAGGDPGGT